jgi:hypothetical protein
VNLLHIRSARKGVPRIRMVPTCLSRKIRMGRVSTIDREEPMIRLFTIIELERMTDSELEHLRVTLHRLLALTDAKTADRRNILATLENVDRVRNRRFAAPSP